MPVIESNEQSNQDEMAAAEKALADNILDHFELPESLVKKIDEAKAEEDKEVVDEKEEEPKAEEKEEAQPEEPEESKDDEDEELIPKSKFQKRLDEMTREKRVLEMRLQKLETQQFNQKPVDEDTQKLQKMSIQELQTLREQTRLAQFKNSSDDAMLNKLFELERKIDGEIQTAPQRFAANQVQQFNEAVQMSASEIPNFDKAQKDIFQLAKGIYSSTPELHQSVNGQARAWSLATEHYKLIKESNVGKSKVEELTREKNTLKQKVSLNGASRKATDNGPDMDKLFKKAKNGENKDKLEFVRKTLNTDATVDGFLKHKW
jgi:hypothetical protein